MKMPKNTIPARFTSKLLTLSCSVLVLTALSPTANSQDVAALTPTSGWNLKSDGNSANGYCALSRSFDDNVVLTLGQNETEEYSLAIDFQKAKLDPDTAYPVTLQPGPGQIRAYEMMPASARAMVIRLGYDDSFFKTLEQSKLLKAEINKVQYNFQINDMGKGKEQLETCLTKIKGDSPTKVANNFKAEKIEEADKIKPQVAPAKAIEEQKEKAEAKDVQDDIPQAEAKAPPKPIEIQKAAVEVKPAEAKAPKEITIERVGQKIIPQEPAPQKQEPAPQKIAQADVKQIETPQAPASKVVEDKQAPIKQDAKPAAKVEIKKVEPVAAPKEQAVVAASDMESANDKATKIVKPKLQRPTEMARSSRISGGGESVSNSLTTSAPAAAKSAPKVAVQESAPAPKIAPEVVEETVKVAKVEPQNTAADLKNVEAPITPEMVQAPKPFSSSQPKEILKANPVEKIVVAPIAVDEKVEAQKAVIKAEADAINQKQQNLAKAVQEQENKLSALDQSDTKNEAQINNIREEIAILRIENRRLIEDAQKARAQLDNVAVESGNQALKRIREYERKLEAAKADNIALSRQMEEMQSLKEQGRLDQVSGDASLTQTTSRYNEAEREIKRLGLLLEQQRTAHAREKQDLEQMLFDPAVTNEEQRRKLSELESKLQLSEQQYARAQEELSKRAAIKPEVIVKPDPKVEIEKQRLAAEKLKLEQELLLAQQQLAIQKQQKPVEKIVVKPDPNVELEKQRLASEKLKLEQELQSVQGQLRETQVALKEQQMQKPVVTAPDPMAQRNNIQIEQLNKKLSLQNQQLEAYQRKMDLEKQQQETLKFEQQKLRAEQEALKQQALIAKQQAEAAANQAKIAQQSMEQAKQRAAQQAQQLAASQQQALAQQRAQAAQAAQSAQEAQAQRAAQQAAQQAQQQEVKKEQIISMLQQSGLNPNGGVRQISNNEYQWNIGSISGMAKTAAKSQTPNMNSFVQGFIANARQSCQGDFASLASQTGQPNAYEIACIGPQSRSSSVLFMERDGHYIAISHETSADDMDLAMDARDKIASQL